MKKILIVICFLISFSTTSQIHFLSDCFKGGVVGDGYTAWYDGGVSTIQLPIPSSSGIRKAYFFSSIYDWRGNDLAVSDKVIEFNGQELILSANYSVGNQYYMPTLNCDVSTIVIDITQLIDPNIVEYTINPFVNVPPTEKPLFSDFYILVFYANGNSLTTCADVYINDFEPSNALNYELEIMSQPESLEDVSLSLHTWGICDNIDDWYEVLINSESIGQIGGEEDNTTVYCAGVIGSFNYEEGTLFGVGNDIANTTMNGLDAIANINPYLNGTDIINVSFEYTTNWSPYSNIVNQLFLTYTTTCDTFSVSTPSDTTVCLGSTLQLNSSTSNPTAGYEWQPAAGLSCTNCPNPIFTADSSMFYTVRIWNNDSCSVVRPLKINVRPRPSFGDIEMTESECGASSASATLFALLNNSGVQTWSEVGGATQTSNVFQNLSAGNHTFYFTDTNGCQSGDTTIFISEINSTVASFSANPSSGVAPLEVVFTNTSSSATDYNWFVDGNLVSNITNLQNWEFANSGYYEITLVAWQFDSSCADTFALTIMVFDSLIVQVPNVFTPNGDGINDFFAITSSLPVDVELVILNRWGVEVYKYSGSLQVGLNALWSGASVTDGTYFYTMKISNNEDTPFVKELENPIEKTGFVEVRR